MPRVFISYSHDDDNHREWVRQLAGNLRYDGIEAIIDQYVEPAPEGGWFDWSARQIELSDHVLCVCTREYQSKYREAVAGKGQGVRHEALLFNNLIAERCDKVFVVHRGERHREHVPLPLRGCAIHTLPKTLQDPDTSRGSSRDPSYGKLLRDIRGNATIIAPVLGDGAAAQQPMNRALFDTSGASQPFATVRLTFHSIGGPTYRVFVQSRDTTSQLFANHRAEVDIDGRLDFVFASIDNQIASRPILSTIRDARTKNHPTRVQVTFSQTAQSLDHLEWECAPLLGRPIDGHGDIALSRSFVVSDEEAPEIRISPKPEVTFVLAGSNSHPPTPGRDPARLVWSGFDDYEPIRAHFDQIIDWGAHRGMGFDSALATAEVLLLPLVVAADGGPGAVDIVAVPDSSGRLVAATVGALVREFMQLSTKPILIFVAPSGDVGAQQAGTFNVTNVIAAELAQRGVASIVHLHKPTSHVLWLRFIAECCNALRTLGVIDAAVSVAANRVPGIAHSVRLHLRNKSARLWYAEGFSGLRNSRGLPWDDLASVFSAQAMRSQDGPRCVAILGPGIDRELKMSRRTIARGMARSYGFSLSQRDEENLARVSEFIRAYDSAGERSKRSSDPAEGERSTAADSLPARPHVGAFLDRTHHHLWDSLSQHDVNQLKAFCPGPSPDMRNALELIRRLGDRRASTLDAPYADLARLRVNTFVTTNFHGILEKSLVDAGRFPSTAYTLLGNGGDGGSSQASRFIVTQHQNTRAGYDAPLVYHAYGIFDVLDSLVLAESDHLAFFADFITPHERHPAWDQIRGQLLDGTLLFLGFHPDSWEFRVLFSAITQLCGSDAIAMHNKPHIAVQLDPEDDLTIDPDGARAYFEGLLAPLGQTVYVYWGSPGSFIADMHTHVPQAFIDIGESEKVA